MSCFFRAIIHKNYFKEIYSNMLNHVLLYDRGNVAINRGNVVI